MKELEVICFGEILWDKLEEGKKLGGAPLNVCYHLTKLGIKSRIVTQVGNDPDGMAILRELERLNINKEFCFVTDKKPTSVVEVQLGENNQVTYEIVENVAWDHIAFTPQLGDMAKFSKALIFGSLASRSETSRETLFKLIEKSSFRVFDVNLRPPYYTKELILALLESTDLLKLNEEELEQISLWLGETASDQQEAVRRIQENFPSIKEILLTRGHLGAVYFGENKILEVPAYKVQVKDTVGSGDSFLAGFVSQKLQNKSIEAALEQASLLSGFVASRNGACPDYELEDLERVKEGG